eukprot:scaffold13537_cov142-Skeletonema_marinoi.AAC.2
MFQQIVEYKDIHGDTLVPAKYPDNLQLAVWVDTQRQKRKNNKLAPGRIDKLNEIGFVWDPFEDSWNEMFQQIVEYKDKHGDTLVPAKYPDNPQLGTWVNQQRRNIKNNKLTTERIDKLNEIGFVWDPFEDSWNEMLQQLIEYKDKHGDTLVPAKYPENRQFGTWVVTQRYQHKCKQGGKDSPLTGERIAKLNEIGFIWDAKEAAWEDMLQQLKQYIDERGDTLVPSEYHDNPQLGNWVQWQRVQYNRRQTRQISQMTDERVGKLNEIDFVWDAKEATWEERLKEIVEYKNEHGNALVPSEYHDNPQLGNWVQWQRVQYNRRQKGQASNLTDERVAKLNEMGFVWEPLEAVWQSKYDKLHNFYKRYGHTKIPLGEQEHKELYEWCMRQRYSKSPRQRYDQLKKVNFDFFTRKISKGSSLIENMIIYELERMGHEFDMLNKVFFNVKNGYRPDGVMFIDEAFVIFFEVDENYHGDSRYPIKKELSRMVALRREAVAQGYDQVTFVRIGTGEQRKVDERQLEFVSKHLHELKSSTQPKPDFSVHYIDYPGDHHHVLASKERFDEANVLNSQL